MAEPETNADDVAASLERELAMKRVQWQRTAEKRRAARVVSFAFLFLVILIAVLGFMFLMTQLSSKQSRQRAESPAPVVTATP